MHNINVQIRQHLPTSRVLSILLCPPLASKKLCKKDSSYNFSHFYCYTILAAILSLFYTFATQLYLQSLPAQKNIICLSVKTTLQAISVYAQFHISSKIPEKRIEEYHAISSQTATTGAICLRHLLCSQQQTQGTCLTMQ